MPPDCEDSSPFARPLTSDQVTHRSRGAVEGRGRIGQTWAYEKDFQLGMKHIFAQTEVSGMRMISLFFDINSSRFMVGHSIWVMSVVIGCLRYQR